MSKSIDLSKYDTRTGVDLLPDDWKSKALEMFKTGGDWRNVVSEFGLTKKQHEELLLVDEYKDVLDNGAIYSEAFWLTWAKNNIENKNANVALFKEMMERMFKWNEKSTKIEDLKKGKTKAKKVDDYMQKWQTPVDKQQKKSKEFAQ